MDGGRGERALVRLGRGARRGTGGRRQHRCPTGRPRAARSPGGVGVPAPGSDAWPPPASEAASGNWPPWRTSAPLPTRPDPLPPRPAPRPPGVGLVALARTRVGRQERAAGPVRPASAARHHGGGVLHHRPAGQSTRAAFREVVQRRLYALLDEEEPPGLRTHPGRTVPARPGCEQHATRPRARDASCASRPSRQRTGRAGSTSWASSPRRRRPGRSNGFPHRRTAPAHTPDQRLASPRRAKAGPTPTAGTSRRSTPPARSGTTRRTAPTSATADT